MSKPSQKLIAGVLAALAGLAVLASAAFLTADALCAARAASTRKNFFETWREQGQTDARFADPLHAEYVEQTDQAVARDARNKSLAWGLLAATVVFLVGAKWLVTARNPRPATPRAIVRLCSAIAQAAAESRTAECACAAHDATCDADATLDLTPVGEIVAATGRESAATIPILQAIQSLYRYLPDAALRRVCELTEISAAQLVGVATFYTRFRRTPMGEHLVTVCHGTACHVAGATRITDELRRRLGLAPGRDTDARRRFTVQSVPCLGCCTLAPVVQVDGVTHGHVKADQAAALLESAAAERPTKRTAAGNGEAPARESAGEIRLGMGSCCIANGSGGVHDALHQALATSGTNVRVKRVGCVGMCHQTPFVEVTTADGSATLYSKVEPQHAQAIIRRHFKPNGLSRRLRSAAARGIDYLRDGGPDQSVAQRTIELRDPPVAAFLGRQKHIATEHYGHLDPLDLDEYLACDGFVALQRCRQQARPETIIEDIKRSGLRGRGGAGFPTWRKWATLRAAEDATRYIICNGDEGDPGAFMDRMLMESYPYRVIEGMAIAALAVGASEGYFYIRAEYPLAVERISAALRRCEQRGLLDDLKLHMARGAGAFVCGEETALIASIEGRRGMPTPRPPYPAQRGLWGRPTLVNNVETYTVVPWIMRNGPQAFAALGTPTSSGTKVFALAGKVARGGLIEVPMGITIREIVEEIGGGVKDEITAAGVREHQFKAVQIGGPSGGCIPARLADTPVDFEALARLGAIMGSGGLVVLDETDCMVDIARYFLSFTQGQSCGECVPCRVGTRRMLEILERLCAGEGQPADLDTLEQLAGVVCKGSLCGLGKTAPNPVLTTLRYFRDEYEAHLAGRCPAGKCSALIRYEVTDACTGCTLCAQHCPAGAIELMPYERHGIDTEKCTRCDVCRLRCPEDAITVV